MDIFNILQLKISLYIIVTGKFLMWHFLKSLSTNLALCTGLVFKCGKNVFLKSLLQFLQDEPVVLFGDNCSIHAKV